MGMTTKEILQGVHDWTDANFGRKDGFYEQLVSGGALALIGQTQRTNDAMLRKSGDPEQVTTGDAIITKIQGQTRAWNQVVKAGASNTKTTRGVTFSFSTVNNVLKVTANSTPNTKYGGEKLFDSTVLSLDGVVAEHKYFAKGVGTLNGCSLKYYGTNVPITDGYIFTKATNTSTLLQAFLLYQDTLTEINVDLYLVGYDLTIIYGEGNEPSSIAQFEADYQKWFGKPLDNEPYDAGSLRSVQLDALKTVGFNQYNNGSARVIGGVQYQITGTYTGITLGEETITPDTNGLFTPSTSGTLTIVGGGSDTCVHISGDRNGEYEPYEEHVAPIPVTTLKGKLNGQGESVTIFPDGMNKLDSLYTQGDKTYAVVGGETRAYQEGDATSDTMVTDGVAHTYVALTTPLIYEVEGFILPKTYLVDGGGTEEQVQKSNVQGLAAILTCIYGVDAVGILDKLPRNYISEASMDNFLAKLNIATGGTWTKTFNENTGEWDFNFQISANTNANTNEESI